MRKNGLIGIVTLFILLLSSCLGDGGDKIWVQLQPAVFTLNNSNVPILVLSNGKRIASDKVTNTFADDLDCFLVEFVIDYDNPENGDSTNINGFYTVDDFSSIEISNPSIASELTDTSWVIANETLIQGIQNRTTIILDQLFLYTTHSAGDSIQKYQQTFDLSFNKDQEAQIINTTTKEEGFEMFLRVSQSSTASTVTNVLGSNVNTISLHAFNIIPFFEALENKTPSDSIKFVIRYAATFSGDTIVNKWSTSSVYALPKR